MHVEKSALGQRTGLFFIILRKKVKFQQSTVGIATWNLYFKEKELENYSETHFTIVDRVSLYQISHRGT